MGTYKLFFFLVGGGQNPSKMPDQPGKKTLSATKLHSLPENIL